MPDKELLDLFYSYYESCWDYLHIIGDRGLLLARYINNYRPEFAYLFDGPEPVHFSDIPEHLQDGYTIYLKEYIADVKDVAVTNLVYTDMMAARDYFETELA